MCLSLAQQTSVVRRCTGLACRVRGEASRVRCALGSRHGGRARAAPPVQPGDV